MVNGVEMTSLCKAFYGALLVFGLLAALPVSAHAGSYYDIRCKCMRPDVEYNTRRVVHAPAVVRTHRHIVDHTNVVRRTRLVQENRLVLHVQPVIDREIVLHRQNTVVRNVTLHRVNRIDKTRAEFHREVINRYVPGTTRVLNEYYEVRGETCGCSRRYGGGSYRAGYRRGESIVWSRD